MQLSTDVFGDIEKDLKEIKKNPFPDHRVAQAALVASAAAETLKTTDQLKYLSSKPDITPEDLKSILRKQLIRTAAQAIRMLQNI